MLVSIIIPTFGRPENLKRALKSVLSQTYFNIEVIVVDDNDPSSKYREATSEIVSEFSGKVKYICHKKNINGSAARNTGVRNSSGKYIAFLDDDDEFSAQRIEMHLDFMVKNNFDFSYCQSEFRRNGRYLFKSNYSSSGDISLDVLCSMVEVNSSTIMISRELYNLVGGFDENFKRNQDYEFILSCLKHEKINCFEKALVVRNIDSQSNQLPFQDYCHVRKSFFSKFSELKNGLSYWQRVNVNSMYHIDLAFYAFRKKNYFFFIKHSFFIIPTKYVLKSIYKKFSKRC